MDNQNSPDLVDKLIERKGPQSVRAFAQRLGISPTQLNDALNRKYAIGDRTLDQVATLYPDLDPDICEYHRQRARDRERQKPAA